MLEPDASRRAPTTNASGCSYVPVLRPSVVTVFDIGNYFVRVPSN